jgi:hypothetical protein
MTLPIYRITIRLSESQLIVAMLFHINGAPCVRHVVGGTVIGAHVRRPCRGVMEYSLSLQDALVAIPEKFLEFYIQNTEFWCILTSKIF